MNLARSSAFTLLCSLTAITSTRALVTMAHNNTTIRLPTQSSHTYSTNTFKTSSLASNFSLYEKLPDLWFEVCDSGTNEPPCDAYCHPESTRCIEVGRAVVSSCNDLYSTYWADASRWEDPLPGWSTSYSTWGQSGGPSTATVEIYTSFSTASAGIEKADLNMGRTTMTPVYALGTPITSLSVTTLPAWSNSESFLVAPKPSCRYLELSTTDGCGQCSLYGGTVQLFFWPPATSTSGQTPTITSQMSTAPTSVYAVLSDGVTVYSPTVYISLQSAYASNSCFQVGQNLTSVLLSMNPADVSTQFHTGGKAYASSANTYGPLDYADLVGPPPLTQYEDQDSCVMFGCPTIYPTFNPTLVVPSQLRSMDPAWRHCGIGLYGLYDPPSALTAQTAAASATMPAPMTTPSEMNSISTRKYESEAVPCSTPTAVQPSKTPTSALALRSSSTPLATSLAGIIQTAWRPVESKVKPGHVGSFANPVYDSDQGIASSLIHGTNTFPVADTWTRLPMLASDKAAKSTPTFVMSSVAVSEIDKGVLVVDGQTLALDQPITLQEARSSLTVHMVTSGGSTFIELGTTGKIQFGALEPPNTAVVTYSAKSMTFTEDVAGHLIVSGSTVLQGQGITLGSGSMQTTILASSISGSPAIIIDGSVTELLHSTMTASTTGMVSTQAPSESQPVLALSTAQTTTSSTGSSVPLPRMHATMISTFMIILVASLTKL